MEVLLEDMNDGIVYLSHDDDIGNDDPYTQQRDADHSLFHHEPLTPRRVNAYMDIDNNYDNDDDDVVYFASSSYEHDPETILGTVLDENSWWQRCTKFVDWLFGPSGGVAVAVIVILFFQFKPQLYHLWCSVREEGVIQTCIDLLFRLGDTIRAQIQLALELGRNVRFYLSYDRAGGGHGRPGMAPRNGNNFLNRIGGGIGMGGGGPFGRDYDADDLFYGPPPPLMIVETTPNGTVKWQLDESNEDEDEVDGGGRTSRPPSQASSSSSASISSTELEPAFLNDEDYPPGWLLYHPILGVVSKEVADAYDRQQKGQQKSGPQQQGDSSNEQPLVEPTGTTIPTNDDSTTLKDGSSVLKGSDVEPCHPKIMEN